MSNLDQLARHLRVKLFVHVLVVEDGKVMDCVPQSNAVFL